MSGGIEKSYSEKFSQILDILKVFNFILAAIAILLYFIKKYDPTSPFFKHNLKKMRDFLVKPSRSSENIQSFVRPQADEYDYNLCRVLAKTHPVLANLLTDSTIIRLKSRSRCRYWRVEFNGCPKMYSISSACMTPIHSPHNEVLVLWKKKCLLK